MTRACLAALLIIGAGCRPAASPAPAAPTNAPVEASAISTVVDGLTGKTAVEAGKRARTELERIGKQEQKDLNDAMQP